MGLHLKIMKILVLNCGSSSIKYKLFEMDTQSVLAQGGIEKIGLPGSFLKFTLPNGEKVVLEKEIKEHTAGVEFILQTLTGAEYGAIKSLDELDAVGHRMVHGGEKFSQSVLLNDEVLAAFEACNDLAPLHNPANLKGVNAISALLPEIPQVGVFDTAFHQTMPAYAYMYALPYEYYEKYGIRRYGFHGTSHRYVSAKGAKFAGLDPENSKVITCHLGNGSSITAVLNGKSIDTTMGFTPLEGLIMGTRCGNIDPEIVTYIQEKEGLSAAEMSKVLNKKSGFLGLSCVSSDARDLDDAAELLCKTAADIADLKGDEHLLDLYCGIGSVGLSMAHRVRRLTGVEIVPQAVECAIKNAERAGIANAKFVCADSADGAADILAKADELPDVVVLDPPRKGCAPELLDSLNNAGIKKIVYISCNPATLARDCAHLTKQGWNIGNVQPVDLFPRTGHVESVVRLTKENDT